MTASTLATDTIEQEITIHAPAERIFDALTNPSELLKWWSAESKFRTVQAQIDLRPGGRWLLVVDGDCKTGKTSRVTGEYREIDRPYLLTYTWVRDQEDGVETLVRWELNEVGKVTTVRVTHSGLITESLRARNDGWSLVLGLLQAHLEHMG